MKISVEVRANSFNDTGYHYIVYRKWKFFKWEIGRLATREQFESFIKEYSEMNQKEFDIEVS